MFDVEAGEKVLHTKDIDVDIRQDTIKERDRSTPNPASQQGEVDKNMICEETYSVNASLVTQTSIHR